MLKKHKIIIALLVVALIGYLSYYFIKRINPNPKYEVGQVIDSLNGVKVYYNGGVSHTQERNVAPDGYNIGLKYQCVEFVKRYYYEFYHHKMPDSYGNAKDFYNPELKDGQISKARNLVQFSNPSKNRPCIGDLIVFDGSIGNPYGHVAIISSVSKKQIEIIQQNPGPFAESRVEFTLDSTSVGFKIAADRLLGWLRITGTNSSKL